MEATPADVRGDEKQSVRSRNILSLPTKFCVYKDCLCKSFRNNSLRVISSQSVQLHLWLFGCAFHRSLTPVYGGNITLCA
ncbi:hypothetical protein AB6A40_007269 [Gnathostoma spinigerum]|uniref:Uncharacterized protein n=1 Tax=Gnathostoma spinigerum TaxID=75299 RepID=A0ABD6ELZ0_9BILA